MYLKNASEKKETTVLLSLPSRVRSITVCVLQMSVRNYEKMLDFLIAP